MEWGFSQAGGCAAAVEALRKHKKKLSVEEEVGAEVVKKCGRIVVAGGGIGGPALAVALQKKGFEVVVLEGDSSLDARKQGYGRKGLCDGGRTWRVLREYDSSRIHVQNYESFSVKNDLGPAMPTFPRDFRKWGKCEVLSSATRLCSLGWPSRLCRWRRRELFLPASPRHRSSSPCRRVAHPCRDLSPDIPGTIFSCSWCPIARRTTARAALVTGEHERALALSFCCSLRSLLT